MKYLTPEIEALSKKFKDSKSLILQNNSCGIFQNIAYKDNSQKLKKNKHT
mgnify:FL=1